jgi:hypothetical protein
LFAAAEVRTAGRGVLAIVSKITGRRGRRSIPASRLCDSTRQRRPKQQPFISFDIKKKEWIGNFKNGGRPRASSGLI